MQNELTAVADTMNQTSEPTRKVRAKAIDAAQFFSDYLDLVEDQGVDENGRPNATLDQLQAKYSNHSPSTIKQKLYAVLNAYNSTKAPEDVEYKPLPEMRNRTKAPKEKLGNVLVEMARKARENFNSID